jgi:hypothetical protein
MHAGNWQTIVLILLFAVFYLARILRKTARSQLDLYDLVMLSSVAIIPVIFAVFPSAAYAITRLTGVAFPFVILFGVLLAVLFLLIHRLTGKLHTLERDSRLLVQELSILRQETQKPSSRAETE